MVKAHEGLNKQGQNIARNVRAFFAYELLDAAKEATTNQRAFYHGTKRRDHRKVSSWPVSDIDP